MGLYLEVQQCFSDQKYAIGISLLFISSSLWCICLYIVSLKVTVSKKLWTEDLLYSVVHVCAFLSALSFAGTAVLVPTLQIACLKHEQPLSCLYEPALWFLSPDALRKQKVLGVQRAEFWIFQIRLNRKKHWKLLKTFALARGLPDMPLNTFYH